MTDALRIAHLRITHQGGQPWGWSNPPPYLVLPLWMQDSRIILSWWHFVVNAKIWQYLKQLFIMMTSLIKGTRFFFPCGSEKTGRPEWARNAKTCLQKGKTPHSSHECLKHKLFHIHNESHNFLLPFQKQLGTIRWQLWPPICRQFCNIDRVL